MDIENIKVGEIYRLDRWTRVRVLALDKAGANITLGKEGAVLRTFRGIKVQKVDEEGRPHQFKSWDGQTYTSDPQVIRNHRRLTKEKR